MQRVLKRHPKHAPAHNFVGYIQVEHKVELAAAERVELKAYVVDLHRKLSDSNINVYASSGVTDGRGGYGYVLYVRSEHYEDAAVALGV